MANNPEVDAWLARYDKPMKSVVARVRKIAEADAARPEIEGIVAAWIALRSGAGGSERNARTERSPVTQAGKKKATKKAGAIAKKTIAAKKK